MAHPFHASDRTWPETNCYADLWVEILHRLSLEVAPLFPFTLASDFEGDQWTFYKPPHSDLRRLYGIDVEELTIWKGLETHCAEQVGRGRMPLIEMDSFYLPDTLGRSYGESHEKTTIGIAEIDTHRQALTYFHNRGFFELDATDYRGIFRLDPKPSPSALPPFGEYIKFERLIKRDTGDLHELTLELIREHSARRPLTNPISRYAEAIEGHLSELIRDDGETYDLYAFASIRQCGSCYAFSADTLHWLAEINPAWSTAANAFSKISSIASMLVMKMARIAYSGRFRGLEKPFQEMSDAWDLGMDEIDTRILR